MSMVITTHIRLDERGVAWIDGTSAKVIEVVLNKLAHGWSPEEIHFQLPHLSLAQIYAALSCYYDHKEEMDREIERQRRWAAEMREKETIPLTRAELDERLRKT